MFIWMRFFIRIFIGIVVSYMLLGLVLSIYRYKNILPEKPGTKAAEPVS